MSEVEIAVQHHKGFDHDLLEAEVVASRIVQGDAIAEGMIVLIAFAIYEMRKIP
jgi:hypothetical protein